MAEDKTTSTAQAITRLETQMENVSTGVNELKDTMKEGFANLHSHVDAEMKHQKANIMMVVDSKADDKTTTLRLDALEHELAKKADAQRIDDLKSASDVRASDLRTEIDKKTDSKEFTFIKSIVLGACALILIGFMGAVTAIVYEARSGNFEPTPIVQTVTTPPPPVAPATVTVQRPSE